METKQERRARRAETMTAAIKALFAVESCTAVDSGEHAHIKKTRALLVKLRQEVLSERFHGEREMKVHCRSTHPRYSATHWTDCEKCTVLIRCGDDECNDGLREEIDCQCSECDEAVEVAQMQGCDTVEGSHV